MMKPHACFLLTIFFLFILLASHLTPTDATAPALITAVSGASLTTIGNKIIPLALEMVKNLDLDDMSSGHITLSSLNINKLELESINVATNNVDAINLQLTKFFVAISGHWRWKTTLLSISGKMNARGGASGSMAVSLTNTNNKLGVVINNVNLDISDFHISFSGSIVAKAISAVKSLFSGTVKHYAVKAIKSKITDYIYLYAKIFTDAVPSTASFGSATMSLAPVLLKYTDNTVAVGFDGAVNGNNNGRHNIAQQWSPSGALFDIFCDVFLFNSGFAAIPFKEIIYNANNPGNIPVPGWKGSDFAQLVPKIAELYPNHDISMGVNLYDTPVMASVGGSMTLDLNGSYIIYANGQKIVHIVAKIHGGVLMTLTKKNNAYFLIPQFSQMGIAFSTPYSAIGEVSTDKLNKVLAQVTALLTAAVDLVLLNGIQIPTVQGLGLHNPRVTFPQDSFRFNTDIDFVYP